MHLGLKLVLKLFGILGVVKIFDNVAPDTNNCEWLYDLVWKKIQ